MFLIAFVRAPQIPVFEYSNVKKQIRVSERLAPKRAFLNAPFFHVSFPAISRSAEVLRDGVSPRNHDKEKHHHCD
jgi:hypothetical protein